MFDFNKKFIALGIEYNEDSFKPLVNREQYNENLYPPTKPIEGGLWGSELYLKDKYISSWQKYIYEKLNPSMFKHRLKSKSTLVTIKDTSKVLTIESFKDIVINFDENGSISSSNLALRYVKTAGNVPKQLEKQLYIDFEKLGDYYDALYVSRDFTNQVDWLLQEHYRRVLNNQSEWDEKITPEFLFKAVMFEDWNVDSILVLNNECINILEVGNF
jgi:hypothetical protein